LFDLGEFGQRTDGFLLRHSPRLFAVKLTLDFAKAECRRFGSATETIPSPKLKPRAMCEHFVVPAIVSHDVAWAEWPNIRRFEHFLYLLNLVNDTFGVHSVPISDMIVAFVKPGGMGRWPPRTAHRKHLCVDAGLCRSARDQIPKNWSFLHSPGTETLAILLNERLFGCHQA
jgi:hypothetical protein